MHAVPSWGALSSCGQSPPHLYSKESFYLSAANLKEPPRPKEHRDAAQGHSARSERLSSPVLMGGALLLHRGTISKQHNFASSYLTAAGARSDPPRQVSQLP